MEHLKHRERRIKHLMSAPFIYAVLFPVLFLDLILETYHHICFPLYGLEKLKRRKYIRFDRHRLHYLNTLQKINCTYCAYVNGLLRYATDIALMTEIYWCGIGHEQEDDFVPPKHQETFIPYGDEDSFRERYFATVSK